MENLAQQTTPPFIYPNENLALKAAKRLQDGFERRKLGTISLTRAKTLISKMSGHSSWKDLVLSVGPTAFKMDRDLEYGALRARRDYQIEQLALHGRIENFDARVLVCSTEPTGYGSGCLRWYMHDGPEVRLPKIRQGNDILSVFSDLCPAGEFENLPFSVAELADLLIDSHCEFRVESSDRYRVEVTITAPTFSKRRLPSQMTVKYRRRMQLWLPETENYPLNPSGADNLYIDYRIDQVSTPNDYDMAEYAGAFILLDVLLSAMATSKKLAATRSSAKNECPIENVNFEVDIDRSKYEIVELGEWIASAYSDVYYVEEESPDLFLSVPFGLITVEDIHVD